MALYFALRNRKDNESECAEVWGINAAALIGRARAVSREADKKVGSAEPGRIGTAYEQCQSPLQAAQWEDAHMEKLVRNALSPCRTRQKHYESNGFVAVALPPAQNSRLASQQGVFLFNGAEDHSFEESLNLMMRTSKGWYKRFRVPADQLSKIEEKLFQLNIHDLSLVPDTEGLAGFVKQKLRLQFQ